MEYLKLKGIVCKITEYKEADKILTLLTYEKGKVQVIAKGVKKKVRHCHMRQGFFIAASLNVYARTICLYSPERQ